MTANDIRPDGFFSAEKPGRKGEILDAAATVFSENGYGGGSMREIAGRVGVSEPALYRHFSGKEAIFRAITHIAAGRLKREAFALIDQTTAETIRPRLIAAFADRRRVISFYEPVIKMLLTEVSRNPEFLAEYRAALVLPLRERLTEKAAELDAALGVADADATRDGRVRGMMSLFVGHMVTSYVLGGDSDEAIADAVLRVMGWEAAA